jgi:magnesium-transporting ATPase (P-type)
MLTFVSAVANSVEQSVLTAVQLMWINLFQDTLAALALATDPPTRSVLLRNPDPKSAPLINIAMWKMIFGQSIYQLAVTLILYFAGAAILSYHTPLQTAQLQTLVFNTYVWMQIFNMYKSVPPSQKPPNTHPSLLTPKTATVNSTTNSTSSGASAATGSSSPSAPSWWAARC